MTDPTSQCPVQDSPAHPPRPSRILATPSTVEQCQAEYAAAADVRQRLDTQIRGGR